ncbi:multiple epidermal growth factor-like domains protein 10 [Bolinopsis microptera]|uniref:multiple epidermal growth factor-like domains protein 10 n=1 Tax=Bolinopsis microptera TaxID=2820187 RepID=UPI003079AC59
MTLGLTNLTQVLILLFTLLVRGGEGATVDVTLVNYQDPTSCSQDDDSCFVSFELTIRGLTTMVKYVEKETDKFKLEPGGNLDFKLGNDALSSGVSNPIGFDPYKLDDVYLYLRARDNSNNILFEYNMKLYVTNTTANMEYSRKQTEKNGQESVLTTKYKVSCGGNQGGTGCTGCKKNYYGTNCGKQCQSYDNFTCNTNGDKICKLNYFNSNCNAYCVPASQYTCNSTTGEKVCEGHWTGSECETCAADYFGPNCDTFCQASSAMNCSDTGEKECLGHFTGQNCSLCETGWYGSGCDLYCDRNSTLWTCDDHGNKICNGKRTGANCTECIQDWYGLDCSVNCTAVPNQYTCNSTTGEKVCEGHWTGSECETCAADYFGPNCDTFCQASSAMNCSDTGEKECLGHFTGQNCSLCETGWYGSGCDLYCDLNSTLWTCDEHGSHICIGNKKGTDCTDCKEGWFGEDCSVECTDTEKYKCTDQGDKTCTSNWNGPNCDRCKEMYFGLNCTCKREPGRAECDNEGVLHCLGHWTGQLCDICIPGYSGPQCSQPDKNPFNRIKVLGKVVYFFLVALVSVLLAVICTFTITVLRKPTKKSLARIRTGIRKNKIFDQGIDDDNKPIMKNKGKMVFIEDM